MLRLPPELRNKIYAYACGDTASVSYTKTTKEARLHFQIPLLLTCRQVSVEVTSLMQSYKVVHFVTPTPLADFVNLVGLEKCAELEEFQMSETMVWAVIFDSRYTRAIREESILSQKQHVFHRMQRIQLICPGLLPPSENTTHFSKSALKYLLGKSDLEVEWVASSQH